MRSTEACSWLAACHMHILYIAHRPVKSVRQQLTPAGSHLLDNYSLFNTLMDNMGETAPPTPEVNLPPRSMRQPAPMMSKCLSLRGTALTSVVQSGRGMLIQLCRYVM